MSRVGFVPSRVALSDLGRSRSGPVVRGFVFRDYWLVNIEEG